VIDIDALLSITFQLGKKKKGASLFMRSREASDGNPALLLLTPIGEATFSRA